MSIPESKAYSKEFFSLQSQGSFSSATIILSHVMTFLPIESACDVGCGAGPWVKALQDLGVKNVIGIDGEYARSSLWIDDNLFHAHDLKTRINLESRYDIAISLEVAEHLPPDRSLSFVEDLTKIAPAVLFSAAVPYQGGTRHINERWQKFWVDAFAEHDFHCLDLIRPHIWDDPRIEVWYRQNIFLFLHKDHPHLNKLNSLQSHQRIPFSLVHPEMFPLGYNMDNKLMIMKFLYWSFIRDIKRAFRGRRPPPRV